MVASYKEIVTKTVIGKGKKTFTDTRRKKIENNPSTILGCWVINHNFEGVKNRDSVTINGSYDVNVWYSYDNDTKTDVLKETVPYTETVHIKNNSNVTNQEAIIRSLKQPNCIKVDTIEKELGIELVGDEKVKIAIDENEDPWDEIIDDVNDKQIDNEVDENFIKEDESI